MVLILILEFYVWSNLCRLSTWLLDLTSSFRLLVSVFSYILSPFFESLFTSYDFTDVLISESSSFLCLYSVLVINFSIIYL